MPPLIEELQSTVISTISSETVSFVTQAGVADAGEAVGTVVYGQLANNKVLNLLGNQMGEKSGTGIASSIVFTTGVMDSTLEIAWDYSKNGINAQIANMIAVVGAGSNGAWACHYPSGLLIVKKKTTGTTQAITSYKVRVNTSTIQTGDIEIGAVEIKNASSDDRAIVLTSDSDGESNTANKLQTTTRIKGFNGSTWDRIRTGITAVTSTFTGWLNTLPWGIYNATPSTRTEGQGGPVQTSSKGSINVNPDLIAGENQKATQSESRMMTIHRGTGTRMTTATTTTARASTGILARVIVEVALGGTLTIYDNASAASGTILFALPIGAVAGVYELSIEAANGITAITSAGDRVVIVTEPL